MDQHRQPDDIGFDARVGGYGLERGIQVMPALALGEVLFVFAGVMAFIWRLQFTFPDFVIVLLVFIVASFFVHRDRLSDLGFGSQGLIGGMKVLALPTALIA